LPILVTRLVVHPWLDARCQAKIVAIDTERDSIGEYVQMRLVELRTYDAFCTECIKDCCIPRDVVAAFEAFMLTEDSHAFHEGYAFAAEWTANQREAYRRRRPWWDWTHP
jgi:hypothetical protein